MLDPETETPAAAGASPEWTRGPKEAQQPGESTKDVGPEGGARETAAEAAAPAGRLRSSSGKLVLFARRASGARASWIVLDDDESSDLEALAAAAEAGDPGETCGKCYVRPGRFSRPLRACASCGRGHCFGCLGAAPTASRWERATRTGALWCEACARDADARAASARVVATVAAAEAAMAKDGPLPTWGAERREDVAATKAKRLVAAVAGAASWAPGVPAAARFLATTLSAARRAGYAGVAAYVLRQDLVDLVEASHVSDKLDGPRFVVDAALQLYYAASALREVRGRSPCGDYESATSSGDPEAVEAALGGAVVDAVLRAAPFALSFCKAPGAADAHRLARLYDDSRLLAIGDDRAWMLFVSRGDDGFVSRAVVALNGDDELSCCRSKPTQFEDGARACAAVVQHAYAAFRHVRGAVEALARGGDCRVVVTGHGVAGAAATLLTLLLRPLAPDRIRGVAFGAPPSCEPRLAAVAADSVVHVAFADDVVPRFSKRSAAEALEALTAHARDAEDRCSEDVSAITKRALELWPPRERTDSRVGAIRRRLSSLGDRPRAPSQTHPPRASSHDETRAADRGGDERDDDGAGDDLVVAGRTLHIFNCHGRWFLAPVDRDFYAAVQWAPRAVQDHQATSYVTALNEIARRRTIACQSPPRWEPFGARDT